MKAAGKGKQKLARAKSTETASVSPFEIIAWGICYLTACTTLKDKAEIASRANAAHPTGIGGRWAVSEDKFSDGSPNPCRCNKHKGRRHFLLEC